METLKPNLSVKFKFNLFGKLTSLIGWSISTSDDALRADQWNYTFSLLKEHGCDRENAAVLPLPKYPDVTNVKDNEPLFGRQEHAKYRSIMGDLPCHGLCTLIDIIYHVCALAPHCHALTRRYMGHAKSTLRYIVSTQEFGLKYLQSLAFLPASFQDHGDVD